MEIYYLSSIEYHANVFQKCIFFNLKVGEKERNLFVFRSCHFQNLLQVTSPIRYSIRFVHLWFKNFTLHYGALIKTTFYNLTGKCTQINILITSILNIS